jgi:hypothetical protein
MPIGTKTRNVPIYYNLLCTNDVDQDATFIIPLSANGRYCYLRSEGAGSYDFDNLMLPLGATVGTNFEGNVVFRSDGSGYIDVIVPQTGESTEVASNFDYTSSNPLYFNAVKIAPTKWAIVLVNIAS